MKKFLVPIIALFIALLAGVITYYKFKENDETTKIRLAEVTHSVFYAPMYVAIEKGYFEDEGIKIELILTPGADKVAAAVLSNDVEVGFAGVESAIYVYKGGEKNYLETFAGLTKRDGQFIVSRKKIDNFTMQDLIGKEILPGRPGGMPILNFLNALKNTSVNEGDVNINTSIDYAGLVGAFIGGNGDFVNLYEPLATKLEKEGYGYVASSIGEFSGEVPYTAFYARKNYIANNKDLLIKFTNAINKGLEYVKENDSKTIAEAIVKQFPDTSMNDLIIITERYKSADSWRANPFISEKTFNNLLDIMKDAKLIEGSIPYNKLITNLYE